MMDETNPAKRLHQILISARDKPLQTAVRDIWSDVLGCDSTDDFEITKQVAEVYALYKDVEKIVRQIPDLNHNLYLSLFPQIQFAIFPLNLNTSWESQKGKLTEGVLTRLEFCANELNKTYAEETLTAENLDEIKNLVNELFDAIEVSADIPLSLRMAILEELEKIRWALSIYRIKGAKGVKEALQSLLGSILINKESLDGLTADKPDILKQLTELLNKLDTFTATAMKGVRFFSQISQLSQLAVQYLPTIVS